jgi:transposase
LPRCSAQSFHKKVTESLPAQLEESLEPVVKTIASLTEKIRDYGRKIEELAQERYPETQLLQQVSGWEH